VSATSPSQPWPASTSRHWWGNLIARHLDLHHPAPFYNGFSSAGYSLVLRALGSNTMQSAYLLSNVFDIALWRTLGWLA